MQRTARFFLLAILTAGFVQAEERFSQRLTAEERKAAGLDQLTPEQLAVLDSLVQRTGRPARVERGTEKSDKPGAVTADAKSESKRRLFGLPVREREQEEAITARLIGTYRGWDAGTVFRLDDGQVWVLVDPNDRYRTEPRQAPRVKIVKSGIGGYKLTVEDDPMWVRVRRVQ